MGKDQSTFPFSASPLPSFAPPVILYSIIDPPPSSRRPKVNRVGRNDDDGCFF